MIDFVSTPDGAPNLAKFRSHFTTLELAAILSELHQFPCISSIHKIRLEVENYFYLQLKS